MKGFLGLVLGLVLVSTASASYISMNTTVNSKVDKNNLKVLVTAINKGDESAFNIQAELKIGPQEILADKISELRVNSTYKAGVNIPLKLITPGTYPLVIVTHYTDANQYPFSALITQTFVYQKEAISPLFGQLKPASFAKKGEVELVIKNLADKEIKTSVQLVAPRELTIANNNIDLIVAPKSEQKAVFQVKNFSALSGSSYQVFALAESEENNLHYTSIAPGTIKIVSNDKIFGLSYPIIYGLLALLIAVFIWAQFRKKT